MTACTNGVLITLEDETRNVNVTVWPGLVKKQCQEVMSAQLHGVHDQWQSKSGVKHHLAIQLEDLNHLLGEKEKSSRDFH